MHEEQFNRLANAIEELGYGGQDSTPGGALEGIALALGGMGTGGKGFEHPIGEELGNGLHEVAEAVREGLSEIAQAIAGLNSSNSD